MQKGIFGVMETFTCFFEGVRFTCEGLREWESKGGARTYFSYERVAGVETVKNHCFKGLKLV